MIEELTKEVAYQLCISRLNKKEKESIEARFPSLQALKDKDYLNLQTDVLKKFREMDKYAVYEVYFVKDSSKFSSIKSAVEKLTESLTFISKPNRTDTSYFVHSIASDSFALSFAKYQIVEEYEEREAGDGRLERLKVQKNEILFFEAEFIKTKKNIVVVLKFPRFRKEPSKLYNFHTEIDWFVPWCLDNLKAHLMVVDLKVFFENLDAKKFDKYGFTVSDVKGEAGEIFGSDFRMKFPFKSTTKAKEMHKVIDKVVLPELVETLSEQFSSHLEAKARENAEANLQDFRDFFETQGLSELFFDLLHEACEHGIGNVRIFKDKKFFRYNLEYSRTNVGLIRVSHNGWSAFTPLFEEIITSLER